MSEQIYVAGQTVTVDGVDIVLIHRKGFRRDAPTRWSWSIPTADVYAEISRDTAEQAIEHARAAIASPKCRHGDPVKLCQPCTYR